MAVWITFFSHIHLNKFRMFLGIRIGIGTGIGGKKP